MAIPAAGRPIALGLRENLPQFSLLVLVNAFVGAMVGQERVLLPLVAQRDFGIASNSAILAFIASFGLVKAPTNLAAGALSDRWGRRPLLLLGWAAGLPVPLLLLWAPSWAWVVAVGVYRLWRDGGYVVGALAAGALADSLGLGAAVAAVAALTLVSGIVVAVSMPETHARAPELGTSPHRLRIPGKSGG